MTGIIKVDTIQNNGGTTGLTIDSSGRVLMPKIPCCHVRLTTSNADDTTSPYTHTAGVIRFDTIDLNQGSCYNASTGLFTCPVAGIYHAEVQLLGDNSTTTNHAIQLEHNNSSYQRGFNGVDNNYVEVHAFGLIECAVNDTIGVRLTSGALYNSANNEYSAFTVRLVG